MNTREVREMLWMIPGITMVFAGVAGQIAGLTDSLTVGLVMFGVPVVFLGIVGMIWYEGRKND